MSVIGIDFGTLNCVISQAKRGGIDTVLNEGSKRQTAALVSFQGKQRFMGVAAVPLARSNYKNTIASIKRFIGKNWSDPDVQDEIANFSLYKDAFIELPGDKIGICVSYNDEKLELSPEEVCAMLIGSLKRTAEFSNEGRAVKDIVFSVPSYWTDRQRRAFLAATRIADVDALGLINDGTAAALSYGIWKSAGNQFDAEKKDYVMFVDMGYSSFQVTIVGYVQGKLEVVASASDPNLGGRDIDLALAKHFAKEFSAKHKADPLSNPKSFQKLLGACEAAKQTLTPEGVAFAKVNVEYLINEIDFMTTLQLDDFNEIVAPIVARVTAPLEQAIEASGLTMSEISAVEIIGGSTRVRAIKQQISKVLGLDETKHNYGLSTTQNADECISKGCALRCAMLSPAFRVKEFLVSDSVTYPIVLTWEQKDATMNEGSEPTEEEAGESVSGRNSIVILEQGCDTPKQRRILFRRKAPFMINASYDANSKDLFPSGMRDHLNIADFKIAGLPEHEGDEPPRISVIFRQDEFGLFGVKQAEYLKEVKTEEADGDATMQDGGDDAAAADGEEKKKDEGKDGEPTKKKKKEYVKYPLQVSSSYEQEIEEAEILNSKAREEEFNAHDRILIETAEKKNRLEEYVYSMRDKLDYALKEFGTESERENFKTALQDAENWLYDEGFDETKDVYEKKFAELSKQGNVFVNRQRESEERPKAADRLRDEIAKNLRIVNSPDEKYAHLEDKERETVRKCCSDAEKWLQTNLDKQASKNTFEDPVFTVADIQSKVSEVSINCRPIVTKSKPPPPKKEEKETEKEDGKEQEAGDNDNADGEGKQGGEEEGEDASEGKTKSGENDMDVD